MRRLRLEAVAALRGVDGLIKHFLQVTLVSAALAELIGILAVVISLSGRRAERCYKARNSGARGRAFHLPATQCLAAGGRLFCSEQSESVARNSSSSQVSALPHGRATDRGY